MWLAMQPERRFTVPPKIMRLLAQFAIRHVLELHPGWRTDVDQVLTWVRRRAPDITLRRKASLTVDEREAAYRQHEQDTANAWKGGLPPLPILLMRKGGQR
jgi:hypothetical protein